MLVLAGFGTHRRRLWYCRTLGLVSAVCVWVMLGASHAFAVSEEPTPPAASDSSRGQEGAPTGPKEVKRDEIKGAADETPPPAVGAGQRSPGEAMSTPVVGARWPGAGGPHGIGLSPFRGPQEPVVKWTVKISDGENRGPAVGADGTIYVSRAGRGAGLTAVSPDGKVTWTVELVNDKGFWKGVWDVSAPQIGPDGSIYVFADRAMYVVGPSGSVRWSRDAVNSDGLAFAPEGTIYLTPLAPNKENSLLALSPSREVKWEIPLGDASVTMPAVGSDGTVFVGVTPYRGKGALWAVTPTGGVEWKRPTTQPNVHSLTVGPEGTVYITSDDRFGSAGVVDAFAPDGTLRWTYRLKLGVGLSGWPAVGADGAIYAMAREGPLDVLHAVTPDGKAKAGPYEFKWWSWFSGCDEGELSRPSADRDGILYLTGQFPLTIVRKHGCDAFVLALEADKEKWREKWRMAVLPPGGPACGTAIAADGVLYAVSGRYLFAFGEK